MIFIAFILLRGPFIFLTFPFLWVYVCPSLCQDFGGVRKDVEWLRNTAICSKVVDPIFSKFPNIFHKQTKWIGGDKLFVTQKVTDINLMSHG
jgi:hypothetical protein